MPERICKTAIEYPPGQQRIPGDRFDVEEDHVKLLVTLGKIEPDAGLEQDVEEDERIDDAPDHEEITGTLHAKRKYTKRQAA